METLGGVALHSFSLTQKQPANYNLVGATYQAASVKNCAAKMVTNVNETAEPVQVQVDKEDKPSALFPPLLWKIVASCVLTNA